MIILVFKWFFCFDIFVSLLFTVVMFCLLRFFILFSSIPSGFSSPFAFSFLRYFLLFCVSRLVIFSLISFCIQAYTCVSIFVIYVCMLYVLGGRCVVYFYSDFSTCFQFIYFSYFNLAGQFYFLFSYFSVAHILWFFLCELYSAFCVFSVLCVLPFCVLRFSLILVRVLIYCLHFVCYVFVFFLQPTLSNNVEFFQVL